MSRRSDSAQSSTLSAPDGSLASQAASDRRTLPWWRLRTWRKDLDALTRLRDGLQDMDFDDPAEAAEAPSGEMPTPPGPAGAGPDGAGQDGAGPDGAGPDGAGLDSAGPAVADPAIVAIRDTFVHVVNAGDEAVGYFYAWLFLRRPGLRELFPPAMDEQRDRLFRALGRIVESLSRPEEMARYLSQLGRDHRKYGVSPDMYDAVGEALIATLRAFAGSAFTSEACRGCLDSDVRGRGGADDPAAAEEDALVAPAYWTPPRSPRWTGWLATSPSLPLRPTACCRTSPASKFLTLQTSRVAARLAAVFDSLLKPREDGLITLHVKAIPGGWVSRTPSCTTPRSATSWILRSDLPGSTMTLAPAGRRGPAVHRGRHRPGADQGDRRAGAVRESASTALRQIYLFYGARNREQRSTTSRTCGDWPTLISSASTLAPVTSEIAGRSGIRAACRRCNGIRAEGESVALHAAPRRCEAYVAGQQPIWCARASAR